MSSRPSSSNPSKRKANSPPSENRSSSSSKKSRKSSSSSGQPRTSSKSSKSKYSKSHPSSSSTNPSSSSSSLSTNPSTNPSSRTPSTPSGAASKDLFTYIETLPRTLLLSLYTDAYNAETPSQRRQQRGSYAAKAILQKLPELARQFVIRLTVCGGEFPASEMEAWIAGKHYKRKMRETLRRMEALCVIEPMGAASSSSGGDSKQKTEPQPAVDPGGGDGRMVRLVPEFHKAIRVSLTSLQSAPYPEVTPDQLAEYRRRQKARGGGGDRSGSGSSSISAAKSSKYPNVTPTFQQLETFTQVRWDSVLHYLVGERSHEEPHSSVVSFLEQTGLMRAEGGGGGCSGDLEITSKGYEFMLNDVHVQVWQFILQYLAILKDDKKCVEALHFLICLSYCRVGAAYHVECLNKFSAKLMKDFNKFGLLYLCKVGDTMLFYPTRVAVNLVLGSLNNEQSDSTNNTTNTNTTNTNTNQKSPSSTSNDYHIGCTTVPAATVSSTRALSLALAAPTPPTNHIAIIVQTNFQVCAYTTSPVHVSMLGLFCDAGSFRRLPNVIFFRITRDTVKRAFELGISAGQILRFLKMHAHPRLRHSGGGGGAKEGEPLVPTNVEDQIILWDRERYRVRFQEVYKELCKSEQEFDECLAYAKEHDLYAWSNRDDREIMVKLECAEMFMAFVWEWRKMAI